MPNILIVEDDININNLLCEVLRKAGYTCEQAFSGTEAKLLLDIKEKAYTLVLLDLMLPGASGEEVLKEIRKQGRLPVIVLTAKDSIDDKIGVLTDGADDYVAFAARNPEFYTESLELEKSMEQFGREWEQQPEFRQLKLRREWRANDRQKYDAENERLITALKNSYRTSVSI